MLNELKDLFKDGLQYTHTAAVLQQVANLGNIIHDQSMKEPNGKNLAIDVICNILQSHKAAPVVPEASNAVEKQDASS